MALGIYALASNRESYSAPSSPTLSQTQFIASCAIATVVHHQMEVTKELVCQATQAAVGISTVYLTALFNSHMQPKAPPRDFRLAAAHTTVQETPRSDSGDPFLDFFWDMIVVIRQAEAAAYAILKRMQERTATIEFLANLIADIGAEPPGSVDWSNNPKMKDALDRARDEFGIDVGKGYKFSETERKSLMQKIEACKGKMERMSQIEMTDMQRYQHEVSMCHETRSNALKRRERMFSTIVANIGVR